MCIFCKIANGEIPSYKVYEDNDFLAFLDLSQTTKGHTLIIPKKHYSNLLEVNFEELSNLFNVVQKISKSIQKTTNATGFNILNNCGSSAGQSVMHFHIHIIPRYESDNFEIIFSNNSTSDDDLKKLSENIYKNI